MNAGMKDMLNVMGKFLAMGMSLDEVIARSTWNPAREIKQEELGHCRSGAIADIAVLRLEKGRFGFVDMYGARLAGTQRLTCEMTLQRRQGRLRPERALAAGLDDAARGLPDDRRSAVGRRRGGNVAKRRRMTTNREFLTTAPAAAAAAAAAMPAGGVARRARAADKPVKKVHWYGGKPPEKTPLFSGIVQYGGLIFISGIGAHFEGDIKAHTKHVLDEIQKRLESVGSSMEKVLKVNVYLNDLKDYAGDERDVPRPLRPGAGRAHDHRRRRRHPRQLARRDRLHRLRLRQRRAARRGTREQASALVGVVACAVFFVVAARSPRVPATRRPSTAPGTVHFTVQGSGTPAIVLVHGWTCDAVDLGPGRCRSSRRRIGSSRVDLPGHGKSAPPQGGAFSMAQFARAVEAVRQAAGVDKAVLVGHSMGATVITRYAQGYPSRVVALVLVDGLLASPEMLPRMRELVMPTATDPARRREMITSMFSPATTQADQDRILTMMLAAPEATARGAMVAMFADDALKSQPVTAPAHGIFAGQERPPLDFIVKMIPAFKREDVPGTGHFLMLEKPAEFNRALLAYLKTLTPEAGDRSVAAQERDDVGDVLRGQAELRRAHHQRLRHPPARADAVGRDDLRDAAHAAHHQRIALLDQHALDRQAVVGAQLRAVVAVRDLGARVDDAPWR